MSDLFDCRDAFADALEELAESDARIVAVTDEVNASAKLKNFGERFPNRIFHAGNADQHMVGMGAGLANGGKLPFICAAACAMTGKSMEQIKVDLGYSRYNVKLCVMSGGPAYGGLDGARHSNEDLAWTRVIPNLSVVIPADAIETRSAVPIIARDGGPVFLRLNGMPVPNIHSSGYQYQMGKSVQVREGDDITLISHGVLVSRALDAAERLECAGISARVINMSTLKPLDSAAIVDAARTTGGIVTVEEYSVHGGLGGAVAEVLATTYPTRMRMLGIPDGSAPSGSQEFLFEHFGLTAQGIEKAAVELLDLVRGA